MCRSHLIASSAIAITTHVSLTYTHPLHSSGDLRDQQLPASEAVSSTHATPASWIHAGHAHGGSALCGESTRKVKWHSGKGWGQVSGRAAHIGWHTPVPSVLDPVDLKSDPLTLPAHLCPCLTITIPQNPNSNLLYPRDYPLLLSHRGRLLVF